MRTLSMKKRVYTIKRTVPEPESEFSEIKRNAYVEPSLQMRKHMTASSL